MQEAFLVLLGPSLVGDVNDNGVVNLLDFNTLKANFGADVYPLSDGDLDGDGAVSLADFSILKGNFGAAATVPEPGALPLAAFAMGGAGIVMRRRRV